MIFLPALFFFVLGLIIGSFLNVVIYRTNTKRSLGGRSACMSCQNKLLWHELIPLFSFLQLRGRCRSCKTKISVQYPLVELTTGLIFALLFCKLIASTGDISLYSFTPDFLITFVYYAFIYSLLLVIAVYDIRHKIIPDVFSFMFGALAFAGLFFFPVNGFPFGAPMVFFHLPTLFELLSGPLVALPFFLFWICSRGTWMGFGDAKLALGIGWLLGMFLSLSALVVAFWSGAIVGIILILISRRSKWGMKSEIPFAPFLVFGTFVAFIFSLNLFGL